MMDEPGFRIIDTDEIDLLALRLVLREAEIRVTENVEDLVNQDAQGEVDRHTDKRAAAQLGRIAADDCWRFNGEKRITSNYRQAKERRYSMYAMHPDTAEQVIKAIEFLIERQGTRLRFPTRPTRHAPETKRNSSQPSGPSTAMRDRNISDNSPEE